MIVLFSDFGLCGPYTGQVQAVLQQLAPGVPAISLFADAPAGQPRPASYLLAAYAPWFAAGTVFVCVVDPGVGGRRAGLIVEADARLYVGPDNGLFELVMRRAAGLCAWQITWQPPALSASFHGRDLFAPVAARLAQGDGPAALATPADPERCSAWPDDLSEIVYIDHYGNAMTGLRGGQVPATARLALGRRLVMPARTFSAVPEGTAFWYVNSNGLVEIAVNRRNAAAILGLAVGSRVVVRGPVRAAAAPRRRRPAS